MRASKALNAAIGGLEHPRSAAAGLQRPMRHAEGHCRDRQRVAPREIVVGVRSLQKVDQGKQVLRRYSMRFMLDLLRLLLRIGINECGSNRSQA